MKKLYFFTFLFFAFSFRGKAQTESFHDFYALKIVSQDTLHFSDFIGKKVLVVNVASFCGFTPQYPGLAALDSIYGGPNFAVLGFPCNDFGAQEPYDDSTILAFSKNFSVGFQLMHKISITAPDTAEVYKWLQLQSRNGVANAPVAWNFTKFCIDEAGHWVKHFPSAITPMDTAITNWIQSPNVTGIVQKKMQAEILLLGNPTHDKINFKIKSDNPEQYTVKLYDLQGRQLDEIFTGKINGEQIFSYHPKKLSSGTYFIRLQSHSCSKALRVNYEKE